ncbi:hypothetical protein MUO93_10585 [Candidatus Bathyarchaeota archaeon]|nr:hypothetical protein [Candidatus Bathyarchaeota archaeon]
MRAAAGDTMTVQYTLRIGAGFTIQFFQFLYSMFRCISVYGYDTSHTSQLLIFSEWEHGGGIYADDADLFLVAGPWDNWYYYYQNTQNFGIMVGDAGAATGVITGVTNPGGGKITVACSAAHGLGPGQSVTIAGTTNYDGTYTILTVSSSAFNVIKAYVSSQTGTWSLPGDDPESLSDYKLQHQITSLTYLGTNWVTTTEVAGNDDLVLSRGFYNGTEDPIDVIEVGLAWISLDWHSYGDQNYFLILRDLLAGAVTVDPGDTATVQYTLRTNVAV